MFIREKTTKNQKTGKVYIKHTLVESYQTLKGPRQRIIMELGELSLPKKLWSILAKELEYRLSGESSTKQLSFPEPTQTKRTIVVTKKVQEIADDSMEIYHHLQEHKEKKEKREKNQKLITIDASSATTTYYRNLGPELVGHHIWQLLGFPKILKKCNFSTRERSLSESVVLGRLINPGSDLSTWNWIRDRSAISELTETSLEKVKKDAIYTIADQLLKHKVDLEKHLLQREKELFPNRKTLYLFDLTNFYLEGQAKGNEIAAKGKSKEKRSDCCLVSLALVVDPSGFPVTSRVYEGNIGEPKTLQTILEDMGYFQKKEQLDFSMIKPTMAMDRGIATKDNVQLLRDNHFPYIVIERCPREKEYADEFSKYQETFECIKRKGSKDVWIHKIPSSDKKTCRILCMSEGRKLKEKAIMNQWEYRAEKDLKRFQASIAKGSLKAIGKVYERMGRIKARYPGFSKRFIENFEVNKEQQTVEKLTWKQIEKEKNNQDNSLPGCYVIESTHRDQEALDIWNLYMTLTRVEGAFRSLKTDLGTRPIFHQLAERTKAHLFISILAYHLLISIEYQLSKHGDQRSWKTIRTVLETHQRSTIILTDENNKIHHIRQSGQPEALHREIYEKLKVKDPLGRNHYEVGKRAK